MSDVKLTDKMRIKHGTQLRLTVRSGGKTLQRYDMPAEDVGSALTVASYTYAGWHPRPKATITLVDPSDQLTGDQLCDCAECGVSS